MTACVEPTCEVTVSDELRALLGLPGRAGKVLPEPPRVSGADGHGAEPAPITAQSDPHPVEQDAHPDWPMLRLRRDGAMPLVLRGLALCSVDDETAIAASGRVWPCRRSLRLILTQAGGVVAHLRCVPPDGAPALPRYSAADIRDVAELDGFLSANAVETCFAVPCTPAGARP